MTRRDRTAAAVALAEASEQLRDALADAAPKVEAVETAAHQLVSLIERSQT